MINHLAARGSGDSEKDGSMCSEEQIRRIVHNEMKPIRNLLQQHDDAIRELEAWTATREKNLPTESMRQLMRDVATAKKVLYFIASAVALEVIRTISMSIGGS